jgi:hypothetical protein
MRFFRRDVLAHRPIVRAGIRFGVVSVNLSFAVGVLMSVTKGSTIGDDGDVLIAHALSIHGIQTIPAVAVLTSSAWGAKDRPRRRNGLVSHVRRNALPRASRPSSLRVVPAERGRRSRPRPLGGQRSNVVAALATYSHRSAADGPCARSHGSPAEGLADEIEHRRTSGQRLHSANVGPVDRVDVGRRPE